VYNKLINIDVFWDTARVIYCNRTGVRGTYYLHYQGHSLAYSDHRGDRFLLRVGTLLPKYMTSHPTK